MNPSIRHLFFILLGLGLCFASNLSLPIVDAPAASYFDKVLAKGALAYASCRAVNASVSVVKESSLHLEPAGVGMSLAIGQVLDPVDDMAERLSDVLVTALASLGLQRLSYEILTMLAPPLLGVCVIFYGLLGFFVQERSQRLRRLARHCIVVIAVTRFALPIAALANAALNTSFFEPRIEQARQGISVATEEMDALLQMELPEIDGLRGTLENSAEFVRAKSEQFKMVMRNLGEKSSDLVAHLLSLTFLYMGVFVVQVVLLPLLVVWLMIKLLQALFYPRVPLSLS